MASTNKRLPAAFYKTESGGEPVREWLKSKALSKEDRYRIGADIKTIEFGWPIGMPTCGPLGKGLWEVRTSLVNRTARILFCVHAAQMVLLHGFIEKTQRTPKEDLEIALDRKRRMEIE